MKGRDEPVKNKFVSAIAPNVTAVKHQKRRQIATQLRSIPKKRKQRNFSARKSVSFPNEYNKQYAHFQSIDM